MEARYIQNLRYKLQKRVRRLNTVGFEVFQFSLKQFWGFIESYSIFQGIIDSLTAQYPSGEEEAKKIVLEKQSLVFDDEGKNAAVSYYVLKLCCESDNPRAAIMVGHRYGQETKNDDALDDFRQLFLEPFYEYVDEKIDDQSVVLVLLKRYKHRCEWFHRERLFKLWENNTTKGESLLALDLYEYLYDQGVDFNIEPVSASGEADLIARQNTDDPLIADAKIFNPDKQKGKSYLKIAFNQIYTYTCDYNEAFGYLVIFKTSERRLKLILKRSDEGIPRITYNNKTIFIFVVDIFLYEAPASKRKPISPVEVTEEYLTLEEGESVK